MNVNKYMFVSLYVFFSFKVIKMCALIEQLLLNPNVCAQTLLNSLFRFANDKAQKDVLQKTLGTKQELIALWQSQANNLKDGGEVYNWVRKLQHEKLFRIVHLALINESQERCEN
jgi:hypothetical protein